MTINPDEFRQALSQFATGVTVLTTHDREGRPHGLTVSSFCSVSLQPPMVLVCIDQRSDAHAALRESGVFGVSVLEETQDDVSRRFAQAGVEKFEGFELETRPGGTVAMVPGAVAHIECKLASTHEAGDHVIYVGEVVTTRVDVGRPLLYHRSRYRRLAKGGRGGEPR
jgi:flavin reductase (DIM6/NTAB) family NADH-FMN oxidoreductase RutF